MGVGIVKYHNVRTVQESSYIWGLYCLIPQRKNSTIIKLYMEVGIAKYHNVRTVQ